MIISLLLNKHGISSLSMLVEGFEQVYLAAHLLFLLPCLHLSLPQPLYCFWDIRSKLDKPWKKNSKITSTCKVKLCMKSVVFIFKMQRFKMHRVKIILTFFHLFEFLFHFIVFLHNICYIAGKCFIFFFQLKYRNQKKCTSVIEQKQADQKRSLRQDCKGIE